MIEICGGCGRRATEEEQNCPACGRPLRGTQLAEQPPGWQLAPELTAPAVRPAREEAVLPDEPPAASVDVAELFRSRPPVDAPPVEGESDASLPPGSPHAGHALASTAGGRGWRVRAGAAAQADASLARAAQAPAVTVEARRATLPRWIFAVLIVSIIPTSTAAVALVVAHIMRSSS